MRFGKSIQRKRRDRPDNLILSGRFNSIARHAVAQLHLDFLHALFRTLEAERPAQFLAFASGESRRDDGHAQQLFLKQRHAERAFQHRLKRGMRIIHRSRVSAGASNNGWTMSPTIGPGRMMATCTTMS